MATVIDTTSANYKHTTKVVYVLYVKDPLTHRFLPVNEDTNKDKLIEGINIPPSLYRVKKEVFKSWK